MEKTLTKAGKHNDVKELSQMTSLEKSKAL